jgi:phosphoribosylformylglycinamidine cyclo-ligase
MQSIGSIDDDEMFRAFNMGIGMILIVDPQIENDVIELISPLSLAYKIGSVIPGNKEVLIA